MQQKARSGRGLLVLALLASLVVLLATGCSDDLYAPCKPDESLNCSDQTAESCVVEPDFQCQTRVCGKFEGSTAFCTERCSADGDCPGGECKQFVLGTREKYCVPSDKIDTQDN